MSAPPQEKTSFPAQDYSEGWGFFWLVVALLLFATVFMPLLDPNGAGVWKYWRASLSQSLGWVTNFLPFLALTYGIAVLTRSAKLRRWLWSALLITGSIWLLHAFLFPSVAGRPSGAGQVAETVMRWVSSLLGGFTAIVLLILALLGVKFMLNNLSFMGLLRTILESVCHWGRRARSAMQDTVDTRYSGPRKGENVLMHERAAQRKYLDELSHKLEVLRRIDPKMLVLREPYEKVKQAQRDFNSYSEEQLSNLQEEFKPFETMIETGRRDIAHDIGQKVSKEAPPEGKQAVQYFKDIADSRSHQMGRALPSTLASAALEQLRRHLTTQISSLGAQAHRLETERAAAIRNLNQSTPDQLKREQAAHTRRVKQWQDFSQKYASWKEYEEVYAGWPDLVAEFDSGPTEAATELAQAIQRRPLSTLREQEAWRNRLAEAIKQEEEQLVSASLEEEPDLYPVSPPSAGANQPLLSRLGQTIGQLIAPPGPEDRYHRPRQVSDVALPQPGAAATPAAAGRAVPGASPGPFAIDFEPGEAPAPASGSPRPRRVGGLPATARPAAPNAATLPPARSWPPAELGAADGAGDGFSSSYVSARSRSGRPASRPLGGPPPVSPVQIPVPAQIPVSAQIPVPPQPPAPARPTPPMPAASRTAPAPDFDLWDGEEDLPFAPPSAPVARATPAAVPVNSAPPAAATLTKAPVGSAAGSGPAPWQAAPADPGERGRLAEGARAEEKGVSRRGAIPLALPSEKLLDPLPNAAKNTVALDTSAAQRKDMINSTLQSFGLQAKVMDFARGPTVTRYEIEPAPGEKISRIASLSNDLARALAVGGVRVEAPVPGKSVIGLEVPNAEREPVTFHQAVATPAFQQTRAKLPIILGKSIDGSMMVGDLAKMPHLLVAGSTGSGKSVCVNTIITSLLYKYLPTELRFVMVDPKMVELTPYDGIPHLVRSVVTNPGDAAGVLLGAVAHMERRYKMMSAVGAKNLEQFNAKMRVTGDVELPHLVIIIDELADLMITSPKEVESAIMRLAQMARATGMHLILATQRPSVDILTSLIKVNIPARIAFAVSSSHDSRTILDATGAERLTGMGDMLFYQPGLVKPLRLQGPYISEAESVKITDELRRMTFEDIFVESYGADFEGLISSSGPSGDRSQMDFSDPLLRQAALICIEEGQGSVSRLQRRLSVGHARAGKLMDMLEAMGIVGPHQGSKPREVLVSEADLPEYFGR